MWKFSVILRGKKSTTSKKRTNSKERTKDLFPKCPLFGGSTVTPKVPGANVVLWLLITNFCWT